MATRNSWQDRAVLKTNYRFTVKLYKNQTRKIETSKWLLTMHKMSCSSNIVSMLTKGIQGVALLDLTAGQS
jgi:ABC-type transporter MlaC component